MWFSLLYFTAVFFWCSKALSAPFQFLGSKGPSAFVKFWNSWNCFASAWPETQVNSIRCRFLVCWLSRSSVAQRCKGNGAFVSSSSCEDNSWRSCDTCTSADPIKYCRTCFRLPNQGVFLGPPFLEHSEIIKGWAAGPCAALRSFLSKGLRFGLLKELDGKSLHKARLLNWLILNEFERVWSYFMFVCPCHSSNTTLVKANPLKTLNPLEHAILTTYLHWSINPGVEGWREWLDTSLDRSWIAWLQYGKNREMEMGPNSPRFLLTHSQTEMKRIKHQELQAAKTTLRQGALGCGRPPTKTSYSNYIDMSKWVSDQCWLLEMKQNLWKTFWIWKKPKQGWRLFAQLHRPKPWHHSGTSTLSQFRNVEHTLCQMAVKSQKLRASGVEQTPLKSPKHPLAHE